MARQSAENPIATLSHTMQSAFQELKADYRIASTGPFSPRLRGYAALGSNADWHWRDQTRYFYGVERARDWDRNNMVVAQGLDRLCDNVLGEEGPQVEPDTGDRGANKECRTRFYDWADDPAQCDVRGQEDLWSMGWLNLRHTVGDGDMFTLPLQEGCLELTENHRCRTPYNTSKKVVMGVQVDGRNRPTQYWFTKEDVGVTQAVKNVRDMKQYPAFEYDEDLDSWEPAVFHMKLPRRVSQTRGVTLMAPVADPLGMHDDLQFAKLVQAQVVSCFAIIEELTADANTPAPPTKGSPADKDQAGERETEIRDDGSYEVRERLAPGMRIRGRKGVKYSGFSPNTPNPEFFPHATLILTFIAINLKLPVAVLLMDPSNTNFSGWRGAIDEARKGFRYLQGRLNRSFFTPVYRWKMRQFIAEDAALRKLYEKDPHRFLKHTWQNPAWDYIEPQKDAAADLLQVRNGLISQRRRCAKRNMHWNDLSREIIQDTAIHILRAGRMAAKLNKMLGYSGAKEVTWRDLASFPTPDGASVKLGDAPEPATSAGNEKTRSQPA